MDRSLFGAAAPDLEPGARNAVEVCLAIQPGERVALIADEASGAVAASIAAALDAVGARWQGVLIEQVATRPLTAAPPEVLDALEQRRRRHPLRPARAGRARRAHGDRRGRSSAAPSATRTWSASRRRSCGRGCAPTTGWSTRSARACASGCRTRQRLRVETPSGTAFTATLRPGFTWVKTSGLINRRYWSNLPAGEVFTTPAQRRRRLRLRRHRRRLLRPEIRRPARDAADAARSPAGGCRRRSARARISSASSGRTATPTSTATASASWRSAPTSPSAR